MARKGSRERERVLERKKARNGKVRRVPLAGIGEC